ncbi:hypothetical protein [Allostreptomyces psammosilenae]|uniref:Uncharacterized protein n=1 Tax=Allostreptomyces psammosilenae TaxID=1892865 RepID=A0A852ZRF6_9ACTN|nr:hypothetical protein [Allostreptomyces psammosilenae]NYI03444.1 hypothetical protein [Allostreptomyces psammosilenae]
METTDPIVFARAAAAALWSYDTRARTQQDHLQDLRAWLTGEDGVADEASVAAQVPGPVLWERMRDNGQYATAEVFEAHFPAAFTDALAADPGAITDAYVYAVTATGEQTIRWNGGGQGAEPRAVTLAVQCRPEQPCALVGVLPTVAP